MTGPDQDLPTRIVHSPVSEVWRSFKHNYAAMLGLSVFCALCLSVILGPWLYPTSPFDMVSAPFTSPGENGFLLGTDYLGRDLLAQMLVGGRVTLSVGLAAAVLTVALGVSVGAFAGFYGGVIEQALMRVTEFFQALPAFLFSMVFIALFGASQIIVVLAIGLVSWTSVARVIRAEFLHIRNLDYVSASRMSGASDIVLIFKVIIPNVLPVIIVQAALMVGAAILFEAGLSFLGLTDPNIISWGQLIGLNRSHILDASYLVTVPGLAIFFTVLAVTLIGDGLNDALNPRRR